MAAIDIESLVVTDVSESEVSFVQFIYFSIDESKYSMRFLDDSKENNRYLITDVYHGDNTCLFCSKSKSNEEHCKALYAQKKELFRHVSKHSKNRLRYLHCELL